MVVRGDGAWDGEFFPDSHSSGVDARIGGHELAEADAVLFGNFREGVSWLDGVVFSLGACLGGILSSLGGAWNC